MGFFQDLGKAFGFSKSKDQGGYYGIKPFTSLKEIPEGKRTSEELFERLAGRRVGLPADYVSATTSPYAESIRANLREVTTPALQSAASARGLGRSSVLTGQIGQAGSQAGRQIGELVADATKVAEMQKRAEINDALARMQAFTGQEAAQRGQAAAFDYGEFGRQQQYRQAQEEAQRKALAGTVTAAILGLGGGIAGGMGAIPGLEATGGSALLGGLTGLSGGSFGQFQKTPLFGDGADGKTPSGAIPGKQDASKVPTSETSADEYNKLLDALGLSHMKK